MRHQWICQTLASIGLEAGCMIEREPAYSQESSERADLILDLGRERIDISTDVNVIMIHTTTPSRLSRSSPPINELMFAEKQKSQHYEPLARQRGERFIPFGLDAFGQLGKGAEELLGNLARKAETSGIAEYGVFWLEQKPALHTNCTTAM